MALVKGRSAFTQLTASGTMTALDVSAANRQSVSISHFNGTGTPTVAATVAVQYKYSGGARWYTLTTWQASLVAGQVDQVGFRIPDAAASVQLVYTAPTGATGFTLDAEVGTETD